jgi:hypothetical protein
MMERKRQVIDYAEYQFAPDDFQACCQSQTKNPGMRSMP